MDPTSLESRLPERDGAARVRLLAALALLGLWFLRWTTSQSALGVTAVESGPLRTGALAMAVLLALWGLSATGVLARTRRSLRLGGALTDAAVALAATILLVARHPWVPGGDLRATWVPIFLPLVLLALVDATVLWRRPQAAREVAVVRSGAALFAAGALFVDQQVLPGSVAIWLGASPLLLDRPSTSRGAWRGFQILLLGASLAAFFTPDIARRMRPDVTFTGVYEGQYGWQVVSALLVLLALRGIWGSTRAAEPA